MNRKIILYYSIRTASHSTRPKAHHGNPGIRQNLLFWQNVERSFEIRHRLSGQIEMKYENPSNIGQ